MPRGRNGDLLGLVARHGKPGSPVTHELPAAASLTGMLAEDIPGRLLRPGFGLPTIGETPPAAQINLNPQWSHEPTSSTRAPPVLPMFAYRPARGHGRLCRPYAGAGRFRTRR